MSKRKKFKKKLENFVKDESGEISKDKVLKIGLGTISALGIMSGFASDTSAGHTNQTSHVNQAARPDAWKQIDGDTCSYLHDNVNTHANHANY